MRGLLEAAFAWELSTGRLARPDDEPLIRERRALMEAATAAAVPIAILQDAGTPCYVTVAGQVPLFGLRVEAG